MKQDMQDSYSRPLHAGWVPALPWASGFLWKGRPQGLQPGQAESTVQVGAPTRICYTKFQPQSGQKDLPEVNRHPSRCSMLRLRWQHKPHTSAGDFVRPGFPFVWQRSCVTFWVLDGSQGQGRSAPGLCTAQPAELRGQAKAKSAKLGRNQPVPPTTQRCEEPS